ncbi:MAG: indole-3-glycerol phosphate synthase TrpC [Lachnospiraceae bacterium]|nr:indole-3-glycerol phosphate synthase TrpC [Lachnospiraceae bacterium]
MADNILKILADAARERVAEDKKKISMEDMVKKALSMECNTDYETGFIVEQALKKEGISFICEVKKASPSKGLIAPNFPYVEIAKEYETAGAACISVLTEPTRFLGDDRYLQEIVDNVATPVLRKDFTVDAYQIYQAKVLGASMILLICSLLDEDTIREYIGICDTLGLSALVETHDEDEIAMAVRAGARIIGVNNRNLKDFTVDVHNSERLRKLVPPDVLFIAESGIRTAKDIKVLYDAGVNGVLIGETLMRSPDKKAMLEELRKGCAKG